MVFLSLFHVLLSTLTGVINPVQQDILLAEEWEKTINFQEEENPFRGYFEPSTYYSGFSGTSSIHSGGAYFKRFEPVLNPEFCQLPGRNLYLRLPDLRKSAFIQLYPFHFFG